MHIKTRMLDGLFVVGGGVANRRRSPERRSKGIRSHTAYPSAKTTPSPNTYKNGRPRLLLATNLTHRSKPSARSIPSSSIPPSLPNIGPIPDVTTVAAIPSWAAFSVYGSPKELHGIDKDGEYIVGDGYVQPPFSAPPLRRKGGTGETAKSEGPPQQLQQQKVTVDYTFGGKLYSNSSQRARSAPNMSELQELNITTVSLTKRSQNLADQQQQQPTQRYTLTCDAEEGQNETEDNTETSKLPQTPKVVTKPNASRQRVCKPPVNNFQGKLERIRTILDKSPEYDGPIKYAPSELKSNAKSPMGQFDQLLIMRSMPRQDRHQQRSPRQEESPVDHSAVYRMVDPGGDSSSNGLHYSGSQRERSMIMDLNQLSRKHHAAKSIRSLDSKESPATTAAAEASRSQSTHLQATTGDNVPKNELPRETMVNRWLGHSAEGMTVTGIASPEMRRKHIVLNVPNTGEAST